MKNENKVYTAADVKKALLKITEIYEAIDSYEVQTGINYYLKTFIESNKIKDKKLGLEVKLDLMDYYLEDTIISIEKWIPANQTA